MLNESDQLGRLRRYYEGAPKKEDVAGWNLEKARLYRYRYARVQTANLLQTQSDTFSDRFASLNQEEALIFAADLGLLGHRMIFGKDKDPEPDRQYSAESYYSIPRPPLGSKREEVTHGHMILWDDRVNLAIYSNIGKLDISVTEEGFGMFNLNHGHQPTQMMWTPSHTDDFADAGDPFAWEFMLGIQDLINHRKRIYPSIDISTSRAGSAPDDPLTLFLPSGADVGNPELSITHTHVESKADARLALDQQRGFLIPRLCKRLSPIRTARVHQDFDNNLGKRRSHAWGPKFLEQTVNSKTNISNSQIILRSPAFEEDYNPDDTEYDVNNGLELLFSLASQEDFIKGESKLGQWFSFPHGLTIAIEEHNHQTISQQLLILGHRTKIAQAFQSRTASMSDEKSNQLLRRGKDMFPGEVMPFGLLSYRTITRNQAYDFTLSELHLMFDQNNKVHQAALIAGTINSAPYIWENIHLESALRKPGVPTIDIYDITDKDHIVSPYLKQEKSVEEILRQMSLPLYTTDGRLTTVDADWIRSQLQSERYFPSAITQPLVPPHP